MNSGRTWDFQLSPTPRECQSSFTNMSTTNRLLGIFNYLRHKEGVSQVLQICRQQSLLEIFNYPRHTTQRECESGLTDMSTTKSVRDFELPPKQRKCDSGHTDMSITNRLLGIFNYLQYQESVSRVLQICEQQTVC